MEYISTRNTKKTFQFKDVFLKGLAPDGGLFVPKKIPFYSLKELLKLKNLSYRELAEKIISEFCSDEFNKNEIKEIINNSYKKFRTKNIIELKKLGNLNFEFSFLGF